MYGVTKLGIDGSKLHPVSLWSWVALKKHTPAPKISHDLKQNLNWIYRKDFVLRPPFA